MKPRHALMKNRLAILLMTGLMLLLFCVTSAAEKTDSPAVSSLKELAHSRIAVTTGSIQAIQAEKLFPDAEISYFSTHVDCLEALRVGRVDSWIEADALLKYMCRENPDLTYIEEALSERMDAAAAFPKTDRGRRLCDEYSEYLRKIKASGVYDALQNNWFGTDGVKWDVPDREKLSGQNGTLRIAVDTSMVPFTFLRDGEIVGADVDILLSFCGEYGYQVEFSVMDFSGVIPSIVSGKCDFACGGIAVTPERMESLYFSEPTYEGFSLAAVRKEAVPEREADFFRSIAASFEKTFIRENRWKLFLRGIGNTLLITVLSVLFGSILGFLIYLLSRKGNAIADRLIRGYVFLLERMPIVVLLMVLYYIVFRKTVIGGLAIAVIAFSLVFGAAMYGMLLSGERAVDKGQEEAASALGYSDRQTFFEIILPQAVQHFMPSYKGQVISLLKGTAVVSYIAVQDLAKMGDIVRSRTYEPFFPLIAVTVLYFLLAALLIKAVEILIGNIDPKRRKPEKILKGVRTHD